MMHKTNSNRWMMTKGIVLPALMAMAVVAFAKPKVEENLQKTQNSSEKLVTFKEGDPNRFAITIPKGTWRESRAYDKHDSYIEEKTTQTPNFTTENVTIKMNGEVIDPHKLADMPASALKKFEQKFPEREINLITTPVQISESAEDDDKIYDVVEVNAGFPGGDMAMYKWIADNLKYPEECRAKSIQGRVIVQFVVNKDGSISEIKVLKSPDPLLSKEAIRVVNAMPKWKPAQNKGKVVASHFRLPINFKLAGTQKTDTITGQKKGLKPEIIVMAKPTGKPIEEDNGLFVDYETNAEFPGGDEAMYKWIAEHLKYPEECKAKGIQGRVTLSFVIEVDGSVTGVKAVRSPDDRLSQEAIRIVSAMPKWKPATQMDKPVHCNYRLPITFRLSPAQTEQPPKE